MSDLQTASRAQAPTSARDLVMRVLGRKRVAAWCEVSESAVSQMLIRATPEEPFPPAYVLPVVFGALSEGQRFDVALLWPRWVELAL